MGWPVHIKRLAAESLIAMATVLTAVAPSVADAPGRSSMGTHPNGVPSQGAVYGTRRDVGGHHAHGGKHLDAHHRRYLYYAPFVYWVYPYDVYQPPVYWYYCPSYDDYYPNVDSCPEPWVPIAAS